MRKWATGLVLSVVLLFGVTGCQVTREWVVNTAKNIAVEAVDKQINKFNENHVVPEIAKIEEQLGRKVDQDDDGLWDDNEIATAIKDQIAPAIAGAKDALLKESDESMTERLKDMATKEDGVRGLLLLVLAWILTKLGIKIGPKGLAGLRKYLEKKKDTTTTQ